MRTVVIKDDLDHSLDADETIRLTVDGVTYTLDLAAKNADKLRKVLEPWLKAAHDRTKSAVPDKAKVKAKVKAAKTSGKSLRGSASPRRGLRAWATANGYAVNGHVPVAVIRAFDEAHGLR